MRFITESSYGRLYTHSQDDSTFAIIGSHEQIKDEEGNVIGYRDRTEDLYKKLRAYSKSHPGVGFNDVEGTYTYDNGHVGVENSLIVYNISKEDAVQIGKDLGQETIFWKDPDFMGYIRMDGGPDETYGIKNLPGHNMNFSNAHKVGYGSKLKTDKNTIYGFTFEGKVLYPRGLNGEDMTERFVIVQD